MFVLQMNPEKGDEMSRVHMHTQKEEEEEEEEEGKGLRDRERERSLMKNGPSIRQRRPDKEREVERSNAEKTERTGEM